MATEPYLLTPGPLTTSLSVKQAMLRDWGSWDGDFNQMTADVCQQLLRVANAVDTHVCVPMQGSGTFAVEAALGTLIEADSVTLVLVNGAYGQRIVSLLEYMDRDTLVLDKGDYEPPRGDEVRELLLANPQVHQVVVVHCETSSGILNPVAEIAEVCADLGKGLIIDSMSAFGAVPVDAATLPFDALISSANKCFEGVPGFGFVLVRRALLERREGNSHSLSLDLFAQWSYMQRTGQWRYTPPTHVVAAFVQAMAEHAEEGGVSARLARYTANRECLVSGMREMGFATLLEDQWLSPIITTFISPTDPAFDFTHFYQLIKSKGFLIYPGKLTECESFRIGSIGHLNTGHMEEVLAAVRYALTEMGLDLPLAPAQPVSA